MHQLLGDADLPFYGSHVTVQMVVYQDLVFLCQVCVLDSENVDFMKVTILKPLQFLHFFPVSFIV